MITIIDLGNYNIKYLGESSGVFSSKYHTNFEPNETAFERIEVNGKKYFIGVGSYSLEYTKANKECLIPQVLYAIGQANNGNNITTDLCVLLPIEQMPKKEEIINLLQKKFFRCEINGKTVNIRIEKCLVLPECQTARLSLESPSGDLLLLDIGSRTLNFAAYSNNKLNINGTARLGIINLYEKIMTIENAKGNDYVLSDIETQIRRGKIVVPDEVYVEFFRELLNAIKTKVSIQKYDVVFLGGGALVLKEIIQKIDGVEIHDNPVFASVFGALEVAKELLK